MGLAFKPLGDAAVQIILGDQIDPAINRRVHTLCGALNAQKISGVLELVPAYASLTVFYRPHQICYRELCEKISTVGSGSAQKVSPSTRVVTLPVLYGGAHGPDLEFVAEHAKFSAAEVIAAHTRPAYLIYMLGFVPGFPYLGGLDPRIAVPRLDSPRKQVAPGSVGIGGSQTGIYPLAAPGGWRLIGQTPVRLFDPQKSTPAALTAGNYIRFRAIDSGEYIQLEAAIAAKTYSLDEKQFEGDAQ